MHLGDGTRSVRKNGEETRGDQDIETVIGVGQIEHVVTLEAAVIKLCFPRLFSCPFQLARRTIDSEDGYFSKTLSQPARIKAGAAPELYNLFAWKGLALGPDGPNHSRGVIAEKSFATENVEPGEVLKQTLGGGICLCFCFLFRWRDTGALLLPRVAAEREDRF